MSVIPDSTAARIVLIVWSSWVLMVETGVFVNSEIVLNYFQVTFSRCNMTYSSVCSNHFSLLINLDFSIFIATW